MTKLLHAYSVSQRYHPDRASWPDGVTQYNYRSGGHELILFLARPRSTEVQTVKRGNTEFALVTQDDLLLLLYRFDKNGDGLPWGDAPYSWHLVPADQRDLPSEPETPERRDLLHVLLVDAADGLIRAIRVVTLSPSFTAVLRGSIREQAARPWPGDAAYDRQLQALYQRFPQTAEMLPLATARTPGGV